MGKEWVQKWTVMGTSGKDYDVSKASDGSYGCTCPAWIFQRKKYGPRKDCQHIMQKRIELGDLPNVTVIKKEDRAKFDDITNQKRGINL